MSALPGSKVHIVLDETARLVRVTAAPTATGRDLARRFCQQMVEQPVTVTLDAIWDLLAFDGDATNADLETIRDTYVTVADLAGGLKYTCLVTTDPCMPLWAPAMDHYYPDRRHLVFRTVAKAEEWLWQNRLGVGAGA